MNSLDDLRTTLRDHAHDLDGIDPAGRTVGIRTKVAEQRRRRNAVRGGVALAAVAAVVSGLALTDLGSGPIPDPAAAIGAPESFTALGWTYELADAVESDGTTQTISLPASERPYLISWKTEGESQDVTVTSRVESDTEPVDEPIWSSSAADWADHVVVGGGSAQTVTVSARRNVEAIAVATYEIDPTQVPAGKGSGKADAFHFREKIGDRVLVDAAVAEGRSEVRFDYDVSDGSLVLTDSCSGVPKGAWIQISLDGSDEASTFRKGCGDSNRFDPGAGSSYGFSTKDGWPGKGTIRMWVSRSEKDTTPLPDSELTGTRLGAALYEDTSSEQVWGTDVDRSREYQGHTWELITTVTDPNTPFRLSDFMGITELAGPLLMEVAHDASTDDVVSMAVKVDGKEIANFPSSSGGRGVAIQGSAVFPPWTQTLDLDITEGADVVTRQALLLYRLAD